MDAKEYSLKATTIFQKQFPDGEITVRFNSAAEVKLIKAQLNQTKKELKQVKREVAQELQAINAEFTDKRATNSGYALGYSLASSLFGGKSRSKGLAARATHLKQQRIAKRAPYESVSRSIDGLVLQIDQFILKIDAAWLEHQQKHA